jgi:D-alanyl-D-alanine carboxypeptidase
LFHRVLPTACIFALLLGGQARAFEAAPWTGLSPDVVKKGTTVTGPIASQARFVPATVVHAKHKPHSVPVRAAWQGEAREWTNRSLTPELRPAAGVVIPQKTPRPVMRSPLPERAVAAHPARPVSDSRLVTSAPNVQAKALCCVDCASNKVLLARNISEPLPIASITKLLTAMTVIDGMKLDKVIEIPEEVVDVLPHKVGLKPGDLLTVRDLLYGLLMESGNDCAEVLARSYPKGGRSGFMTAMNRKAAWLGASKTTLYTPSGLDMKVTLGRRDGLTLEATKPNVASARDVALIARTAFKYPLVSEITSTRTHVLTTRNSVPRKYHLTSTIKLLKGNLPVAGAKTGFTNMAGRCIVALFKDQDKEHMVVVLNSPKHFKAAEKIYRWASHKL